MIGIERKNNFIEKSGGKKFIVAIKNAKRTIDKARYLNLQTPFRRCSKLLISLPYQINNIYSLTTSPLIPSNIFLISDY